MVIYVHRHAPSKLSYSAGAISCESQLEQARPVLLRPE